MAVATVKLTSDLSSKLLFKQTSRYIVAWKFEVNDRSKLRASRFVCHRSQLSSHPILDLLDSDLRS